jgi:hypothetical protein
MQEKKEVINQELKRSFDCVNMHGTIEDKVNWLMNRFAERFKE